MQTRYVYALTLILFATDLNFLSSEEKAKAFIAKEITKAWKNHVLKRAVREFNDMNVLSLAQTMTDSDVITFLRRPDVISKSYKFILEIHKYAVFCHSPLPVVHRETVNVRVVLAALLIVHHPNISFKTLNAAGEKLIASANVLISNMHQIAIFTNSYNSSDFQDLSRNFVPLLYQYLDDFKEWKTTDEVKILEELASALVMCYRSRDACGMDHARRNLLDTQISNYRSRIAAIGGQMALDRLDVRREVMNVNLRPPMDKEQMAHELLLNPDFQIPETGFLYKGDDVEQQHAMIQDIYLYGMVADYQDNPPVLDKLFRIVDFVKKGIVELSADQQLHQSVMELMDHCTITTNVVQRNWPECQLLVEKMLICINEIPTSDIATKQLMALKTEEITTANRELKDYASTFGYCIFEQFKLIRKLRRDVGNAQLRMIAPVVATYGVEFERRNFEKLFQETGMQKFKDKISKIVYLTVETSEGSLKVTEYGSSIVVFMFYSFIAEAIISYDPESMAEVFMYDVDRIEKFQKQYTTIFDIAPG